MCDNSLCKINQFAPSLPEVTIIEANVKIVHFVLFFKVLFYFCNLQVAVNASEMKT